MDLQIRSHDLPLDSDLETFATSRVARIDHLLEGDAHATLELRRQHHRTGGDVTKAQMTIHIGRRTLRTELTDIETKRAIDQVVDKMERQIRRFHERRTARRRGQMRSAAGPESTNGVGPITDLSKTIEDDDIDTETGHRPPILRTKRFLMKPMPPDEAIEHMELLGHSFFLFLNSDEDTMNVVYRRNDGTYGLLAPEDQ